MLTSFRYTAHASEASSLGAVLRARRCNVIFPLLPCSGICITTGCWWDFYGPGWVEASRERVRVHHHTAIWRVEQTPGPDKAANGDASEAIG